MKKVLVTGAGGFIGSHLVDRLVKEGYQVRCFVRYNSRNDHGLIEKLSADVRNELDIFAGDLRDPDGVAKSVEGCSWVFHLGALIAIPYSYIRPIDVLETNVMGTANVVTACLQSSKFERMVHTSTSEVYGTALYVPIDEKHPLQAQSPYAASKVGADKFLESACKSYGFSGVTLRPFNTYGPRQSARAVIPTIATQLLTQDVVRLGSLTPRRDFLFVADTVEGFLRAAKTDGVDGETFHIGTGTDVSIGDLFETMKRLSGREIELETDDDRMRPQNSEVERLLCTPDRAKELLGWEPKHSLEDGLGLFLSWLEDHIDSYKAHLYNV